MIHVLLGTKPEYIKTAPLLRSMKQHGVPYRLIDTGQHADLVKPLFGQLGISSPDFLLQENGNLDRVRKALAWFLRHILVIIFRPGYIRQTIFNGERGICIVHGDTPSTLLSTLLAKRAGLQIAHVEAGLSSARLFRPFPEELIRKIVTHFADYLFVPGENEESRMRAIRPQGMIINTGVNTGIEELRFRFDDLAGMKTASLSHYFPSEPYGVITCHRVETIMSRRSLQKVIEIIALASQNCRQVLILHPPTRARLIKFGLLESLRSIRNVTILPVLPHLEFLNLIAHADFVMTDGGGIQEECAYMGIPTLLLRKETERREGLGRNVILNGLHPGKIVNFLNVYPQLRFKQRDDRISPSAIILRNLLQLPGVAEADSPLGSMELGEGIRVALATSA